MFSLGKTPFLVLFAPFYSTKGCPCEAAFCAISIAKGYLLLKAWSILSFKLAKCALASSVLPPLQEFKICLSWAKAAACAMASKRPDLNKAINVSV